MLSSDQPVKPIATPREAAAVILVRERSGSGTVEIFMIQRTHKTSFMGNAYVFPGGAKDPEDKDLRATAARELFEEAGVLLSREPIDAHTRATWRQALHSREPLPRAMREELEAVLDLDAMHYYAQWITPSVVPKRFSATFYVAVLTGGQEPEIDNREAVDAAWVTPAEGLERSRELHLHPPQLRTLLDMRPSAELGLPALLASTKERLESAHAILPRHAPGHESLRILLPWDPEYLRMGMGEALTLPAGHPLAVGPSRFVLEDKSWKHISAPTSPSAE